MNISSTEYCTISFNDESISQISTDITQHNLRLISQVLYYLVAEKCILIYRSQVYLSNTC